MFPLQAIFEALDRMERVKTEKNDNINPGPPAGAAAGDTSTATTSNNIPVQPFPQQLWGMLPNATDAVGPSSPQAFAPRFFQHMLMTPAGMPLPMPMFPNSFMAGMPFMPQPQMTPELFEAMMQQVLPPLRIREPSDIDCIHVA